MQRQSPAGALVTLICLTVFAAVFITYTTQYLPNPVATHFGANNRANGWMSRGDYLLFVLAFTIGVPTFASVVIGTVPRKFPSG